MNYHKAYFNNTHAQVQIKKIEELATQLNANYIIQHTHTSQSICLPVPTILVPGGLTFLLRDNFHDLNLLVISEKEINLPLEVFYEAKDITWYLSEIQRKRNYCFRDWTEEEMEDPRILRVRRKNDNGWSEKRGDEKDRWAKRMTSTEWYGKDWSSGKLLTVGSVPFNEGTVFYCADKAFAEGIPSSAQPYTKPCNTFMNCLRSWEELTRLCLRLVDYTKNKL